jgi:hypothetical protein
MVMIRTIQVRMTRDQYERVKNNSRVRGFNSLSAYLRFVALDQDLVLQHKIFEIHAHLLGQAPTVRSKRQPADNRSAL